MGDSYNLVQVWVAPWRCQKRKLRQVCPSSHGTPQGTWAQGSPQRCISPFPPWAPESQGGCEGLERAAGSPLLTSSGCWAGVSYNQKRSQHSTVITEYKKNPKPGTRRMARAPQPTQGVPRRIYVQRVLDGSNTRKGEQRALTPKPAWGGDPGDPRGKRPGWPGPAAAGGCRTDGGVGGVSTMGRRGGTHRPRAPRAEVAAASEGTAGDARSRGV